MGANLNINKFLNILFTILNYIDFFNILREGEFFDEVLTDPGFRQRTH